MFLRNLQKHTFLRLMYRQSWVDVFIKCNTLLPSSAAAERLFSMVAASAILTAKRASLTSRNLTACFSKGKLRLFEVARG